MGGITFALGSWAHDHIYLLILKSAVSTCHHIGQLLRLLNKLMLQTVSLRYWTSRAMPIIRLTITL